MMAYRGSPTPSSDDSNDGNDSESCNTGNSNIFRNDGSFLEMFKKMQNASQLNSNITNNSAKTGVKSSSAVKTANIKDEIVDKSNTTYKQSTTAAAQPPQPFVGRRRGMKILPVGKVKKLKTDDDSNRTGSKDAWAKYLEEVKKYKETYCDSELKNRSLVK